MRSLIGMLAVVSVFLALVLKQPELFIAAGLLVVAVLISWLVPAMRSRATAKKNRPAISKSSDKDRESLGILSIKAKEPSNSRPQVSSSEPVVESREPAYMEPIEGTAEEPDADPDPPPLPINGAAIAALPDAYDADVLLPILEGFRAALGAHAVCVLRQNDDTYQILGTAGQNFAKRSGEYFKAPVPLVPTPREFAVRVIVDDLPPRSLGYSFTPGSVLRIIVAPVGTTPLILLADTTQEHGLTHPKIQELFEKCTGLLKVLFYKEDPNRPRVEIIAEEMAMARAVGQQLALAIVVLRNNEQVAELGAGVISQVESQLRSRLQGASPATRVVRFGELMFGVFINGQLPKVEAWNRKVQASLDGDEGLLGGGVFIGIALLSDQHVEANDLRDAAKDALLSAYQEKIGTVISNPVT